MLNAKVHSAKPDLHTESASGNCQVFEITNMYRPPGAADREFWLYFVGFLASKLVGKGPDNPQDSFGPSFKPNGRFSTHFKPNLMFLAPTGTLVSQDLGLAWLWTSPIAAGKADPLSETSTSVLSQQQTSILSQQQWGLSKDKPSSNPG